MQRGHLALSVCILAATVFRLAPAQEISPRVEVHGFSGWAYGRTAENTYIGGDPRGNYQRGSLALNLAAHPAPRLSIISQAFFKQTEEGTETELDYAFLEMPTMPPHATVLRCALSLLLSATPAHLAGAQDPIAVIVHPSGTLADLSLETLQRLFLGRSALLPNKESVVLLESAWLRDRFYSRALGMNADRFKRHWIGVIFSGEGVTPPREMGSPAEVLQYVATHRGAVAFIELRNVDSSVRTVSISGLRATDPDYRLRERP